MHKPVVKSAESIRQVCLEANAAGSCVGVVAWMHTFSPAKMWIAGLRSLQQPLLHLHTQFNRDLPWAEIDMDFMNLNQSAHGDREFGFMETRMGLRRKTVPEFRFCPPHLTSNFFADPCFDIQPIRLRQGGREARPRDRSGPRGRAPPDT